MRTRSQRLRSREQQVRRTDQLGGQTVLLGGASAAALVAQTVFGKSLKRRRQQWVARRRVDRAGGGLLAGATVTQAQAQEKGCRFPWRVHHGVCGRAHDRVSPALSSLSGGHVRYGAEEAGRAVRRRSHASGMQTATPLWWQKSRRVQLWRAGQAAGQQQARCGRRGHRASSERKRPGPNGTERRRRTHPLPLDAA
jgi:hypothetical protein